MQYNTSNAGENEYMGDVVLALMTGKAAKWLDRLTVQGQLPTSYTMFKTLFLKHYSIIDDENEARDTLKVAKQQSPVQQYVEYFNDNVTSLPNTPSAELVHSFVFGLKAPLKSFVKA